jgi:hypothetical protein
MKTSTVKSKTINLPNSLTIALGQYFLSYAVANSHRIGSTHNDGGVTIRYSPQLPWDKDACLERITAALPKGWGYQACAGSFWIFKARNKKTHYYIHKEIWPLAEIHPN